MKQKMDRTVAKLDQCLINASNLSVHLALRHYTEIIRQISKYMQPYIFKDDASLRYNDFTPVLLSD